MSNLLFISFVSDEFQKPGARCSDFRSRLAAYFRRAYCDVKVQGDFRQVGALDQLEKLAGYFRTCAAIVRLVGEEPGSLANSKTVEVCFAAELLMRRALSIYFCSLVSAHPDVIACQNNYSILLAAMNVSDAEIEQRLREAMPK
jgi:hypothetical protein